MNYQVSVNKIKELFNPLEDRIFPVDISYTTIERLLNTHDIFPENENDIARTIAYRVANYELRELNIVIPYNLDKNNKQECASIFIGGIIDITAAIYLGQSHVICTIEGDSLIVKKLLDIDLENPDNIALEESDDTSDKITWKLDETMLVNTWGDKEFILSYFITGSATYEMKIKALINFMPSKLWEDSQFLCDLFLTSVDKNNTAYIKEITKIQPEILNKESFFEAATKDKRMFYLLWSNHYLPMFNLALHSQESYQHLAMPYLSYERIQELKPLMNKVKETFLNDETTVTKLLQSISFYSERGHTLKYIEPDILLQPSILRQLKEVMQYFNIKKSVPEQYLQNFDWLKDFFVILSGNLNLHNLKNSGKERNDLSIFFASWINDKDKVLEMLNVVKDSEMANLYYILPEKLKFDHELINTLITKNPLIFISLPESIQPNYIELYIEHASLVNYLPVELFSKISNRESMKKLVSKGYDKWIGNTNLPKKLAYDVELLTCLPNITKEHLDEEFILMIEQDNNNITNIMKKYHGLYEHLSKKKQRDCYIALHALAANYTELDPIVYNSKGFCLTAIELQPKVVDKIPKPYWNDKGFVIKLLAKIDEGKIPSKVLIHAPKELVHLLSFFEIQSNYSGFLQNYFLNNKLESQLNNKNDEVKPQIKKKKI